MVEYFWFWSIIFQFDKFYLPLPRPLRSKILFEIGLSHLGATRVLSSFSEYIVFRLLSSWTTLASLRHFSCCEVDLIALSQTSSRAVTRLKSSKRGVPTIQICMQHASTNHIWNWEAERVREKKRGLACNNNNLSSQRKCEDHQPTWLLEILTFCECHCWTSLCTIFDCMSFSKFLSI